MRCHDFDALVEEMLSGILHPDGDQHMRQCERCSSHYRARTALQSGLRKLASVPLPGPSQATDRAVMEAYRRLRQQPAATARVIAFPSRSSAPARASHVRAWWGGGAAAAAVALAMLGAGLHPGKGVSTVSAPTAVSAPATSVAQSSNTPALRPVQTASVETAAKLPARRSGLHPAPAGSRIEAASEEVASAAMGAARAARKGEASPAQPQASASPLIHMASTGTASGGNVAKSPSSTWPGYSNLMYCDPVVCSGPMEVVHIKVPAGQVKPNSGQSGSDGFVNADVVVGPDGVARAIRVAN